LGGWRPSKVYVVNLMPAVAAVGLPSAPAHNPAPPAPLLPSRAPAPMPTPAPPRELPPRELPPRELPPPEAPRLPAPSLPSRSLPPRSALVRPGEKEVPPVASATTAQRIDKSEKVEQPVESRPAPVAPKGLPTGSPAGVGALSLDASDFPYAWYLRQVLQKVQ